MLAELCDLNIHWLVLSFERLLETIHSSRSLNTFCVLDSVCIQWPIFSGHLG